MLRAKYSPEILQLIKRKSQNNVTWMTNFLHQQNAKSFLVCLWVLFAGCLFSQHGISSFINGDPLPDAPDLATRGSYTVGVRTVEVIHKDQVDVLNSKDSIDPLYNRPLTLEIWYPAENDGNTEELVVYDQVMGLNGNPKRPLIPFTFQGRAIRDAVPLKEVNPYPLVIVSHGYPGSRLLLTYLTENLASKGYVVVAIDHTESTYRDLAGFQSTLLNRPKDILFVLDQMAHFSINEKDYFLFGIVDANNSALIGYSMGGYGVLNTVGAGFSNLLVNFFAKLTGGSKAIVTRTSDHPEYAASFDARIKAVVAFAPWGMARGVWDEDGLKGVKVPTFFIAGSEDDVSGYEDGIKAIYEGVVNADRYLLTYINARHNVAPNPPPLETLRPGLPLNEYFHYAEPAWDENRINNINQHFVTAFIGIHLKQMDYIKYLNLNQDSNEKNWIGFKPRTSVGLELRHATPDQDTQVEKKN